MRSKKNKKKIPVPVKSLYNRCLLSLAVMAGNTRQERFDVMENVDRLVLEVSRRYTPGDSEFDLDEIISKVAMNLVFGWTDEIPF